MFTRHLSSICKSVCYFAVVWGGGRGGRKKAFKNCFAGGAPGNIVVVRGRPGKLCFFFVCAIVRTADGITLLTIFSDTE